MEDNRFILPLMIVLLLHNFVPTLFMESPNITTDQLAFLALKAHVSHDPLNLLANNWSTSTSVCTWIGVSCGSKHHRVTVLNLTSMSLTGTIPPNLGNLSFLTWLNIRNNSFHGSLPIELTNLHRLKLVDIGGNNFSGEIPPWFGSLTELQSLFLYQNNFAGVIPSSLGYLSKLEKLVLYNNNLEGQIPVAIANLSNLQWLYLDYNHLSGHLPSDIFDHLPKLQQLSLTNNQFSGPIPASLTNCKELELLYFSNNSFEGSIPAEIGNMTMLEHLYLDLNNLEGSIPSSILNVSSLQVILLGKNKLSGHLSSDMFNHLPELLSLDLSENQFSGRIPTSLFQCKELEYLYLDHNQLEGTVPMEIRNLTWLTVFTLRSNSFQGEIPPIIRNMSFLNVLDFSSNNLKEQPVSNYNLQTPNLSSNLVLGRLPSPPPSLSWFYLSDNNLVGHIPSSICKVRSLKGLGFSKNNLVGTIPHCLGNLSFSLVDLELQDNNFHGTIPGQFAKGCSVRNLKLNGNQLEGSLPRSLVNCSDLVILDVANNKLNDTFPHWLGILNIQILVLRSNRFYGQIDDSEATSSFSQLRIIDLSCNDFVGYLPTKFFKNLHAIRDVNETNAVYMRDVYDLNVYYDESVMITTKGLQIQFTDILTIFTFIDFSNNRFGGKIPEVLGELHSLLALNLSHNSLTGSIPSVLGNLSALESLDLSSNKLQGRIPEELVNLIFLEVLNLSLNNFTGPIPRGKQFDTFSNDSYIGNLGLCGLALSKTCENDQNSETHPKKVDEVDDTTRELNWKFSILMGYGCGVVFGLSMGYIVFTTGKPWWFIKKIETRKWRK